tara:strand:+ start:1086 stop:1403 length:318 start_codon:yes stop_codon:yes gene_type:complete
MIGNRIEITKKLLFITFFLSILDGLFTIYWLEAGMAVEANPLLDEVQYLSGTIGLYLYKFTLVTLGIILLWRRADNKYAQYGALLVTIFYMIILIYHVHSFFLLF